MKDRMLLILGITILLAAGALAVMTQPAHADTNGYVSRHEYKRVHEGMTKLKTHRIFDTHGQSMQLGPRYQTRVYDGWKPEVHVYVKYKFNGRHWLLAQKSAEASVVIA